MVQRLPSVDMYKLLTAAYAGLMACLCSWAVFIMPHGHGANMTVLAPIWALVSAFLNLNTNYDQSLRSIVGALIGLGLTQLIALVISSAWSSGYNDWIGVVVCFPVCFLLGIADPATGCKLSKVFRSDVAMESMYIPLAFPNGKPFLHSLLTSGAFIVGSVETLIVTTVLNAFNLLPRHEVPPIPSFAKRAADYYETLSTYCTSGMQHAGFIDRQRAVFEEAWRAASRAAPTPELRSVIYRMAAELIALRTTLRDGAYSPDILEYIWHPLVPNIVELRLETVYWLRLTGIEISDDEIVLETGLVGLANQMKERLNEQSLVYGMKVFSGESSLSPATDSVRFQFAMSLIARFAVLADNFRTLVREYEKSLPEAKGWFHWPSRLRQYLAGCMKYWVNWWRLPFFAYGNMTLAQRFVHPLRLSITITAFALPLVAWAHQNSIVEIHGFWALVPILFCFLQTPGASLVKGTRRIVGTILAAALAIVCVSVHPYSPAAFVVEMFVITFVGKLGSLYASIDYGGTVFAFTWMLVGIIPTLGKDESRQDMILWSLWRVAMTLIGTIGGTIVSMFVFPTFAMQNLNRESAHELLEQADLVARAVEQLCSLEKGPSVNPEDRAVEGGDEFFRSSDTRFALLPDAKAEAIVLDKTAFVDDTTRAVLSAQEKIDSMGRSALVAHTTLADCARRLGEPSISNLLAPLRDDLYKLATSLRDSASQVALTILDDSWRPAAGGGKETTRGRLRSSQVNVEMQRIIDIFVKRREDILAGEERDIEGWSRVVKSGCYSLYHAIYTMRVFCDDWVHIETIVLGLAPVVQMRARALSGAYIPEANFTALTGHSAVRNFTEKMKSESGS